VDQPEVVGLKVKFSDTSAKVVQPRLIFGGQPVHGGEPLGLLDVVDERLVDEGHVVFGRAEDESGVTAGHPPTLHTLFDVGHPCKHVIWLRAHLGSGLPTVDLPIDLIVEKHKP